MARPTIRAGERRQPVSISVSPEILELASIGGNKSNFFEKSIQFCQAIHSVCDDARSGKLKRGEAFDKVDELIKYWHRLTEETIPFK